MSPSHPRSHCPCVRADRSADEVVAALPSVIRVRTTEVEKLKRDGQALLRWDETPVYLFLDVHAFHRGVAQRVWVVPFEGVDIPVLALLAR